MILGEIRKGCLEEVALDFSLAGCLRVRPTEMLVRSTSQGNKGQWVKVVWL